VYVLAAVRDGFNVGGELEVGRVGVLRDEDAGSSASDVVLEKGAWTKVGIGCFEIIFCWIEGSVQMVDRYMVLSRSGKGWLKGSVIKLYFY
jgi:hypothetical protein